MRQSSQYFDKAQGILVGGVNSPVRAFGSVGGTPLFFDHAKGPYLYDVDGNRYIDYVLSWGPMILGHADEDVLDAVHEAAEKGLSFGAPSPLELSLAEKVQGFFPHCEKVRFVSSGTEATMSALRLARGYTGRDVIVKFEGCYHGHSDALLVSAGSGALTFGQPNSAGVPDSFVQHTRVLPFNDVEALEALFKSEGDAIAAIIVEPVPGNMGLIHPQDAFLRALRGLCDEHGALLIFDEVMSGFRVHPGGAQGLFGVTPDMTCLGKVVGGGMPCGAFGASSKIMDKLAPLGPVYQAGTLSGNPVAMAAGLVTLSKLDSAFSVAAARAKSLSDGLASLAASASIPFQASACGTMFGVFFSDKDICSLDDVKATDLERFNSFFHGMLSRGIYLAPSAFEAGFLSSTHGEEDIQATLAAAAEVFADFS